MRFQYSLRTLLIFITVSAIAMSVWRTWHIRLETLLHRFESALNTQDYDEADDVALTAIQFYPHEPKAWDLPRWAIYAREQRIQCYNELLDFPYRQKEFINEINQYQKEAVSKLIEEKRQRLARNDGYPQ